MLEVVYLCSSSSSSSRFISLNIVSVHFYNDINIEMEGSGTFKHFITSKSIKTFLEFTLLKFVLSTVQHIVANPKFVISTRKFFSQLEQIFFLHSYWLCVNISKLLRANSKLDSNWSCFLPKLCMKKERENLCSFPISSDLQKT